MSKYLTKVTLISVCVYYPEVDMQQLLQHFNVMNVFI